MQGRNSQSKRQNGQATILHKKDTHVYKNCYELRSRAIKNCKRLRKLRLSLENKHSRQIAGK